MRIKIALLTTLLLAFSSTGFAQSKTKAIAPDVIVQNLYAAQAEGHAAPTSNTTSDIRSVDFLNYSYHGSVCSEDVGLPKTVKVRNGNFKDRDSNFFEIVKEEIAYGDVNGDGSEDAVVLIRCGSAAGTLRAFEVHAYSFQNGQASLLARLDSTAVEGDYKKSYANGTLFYAGENGPKIVGGHVIVEALADGSFAGPENVATFDYQLRGNKFVLSGKPTRTDRSAHALPSSKAEAIEQLAKDVAEAWSEGRLGSLDAKRPYVGWVRIRVEDSIADGVESRRFKTLAQAERWFKSRERADGPGRNIGPLQKCSKGVCTFEQTGMLHNNLYLQKITYGLRGGRPYIKAIHVIDGN